MERRRLKKKKTFLTYFSSLCKWGILIVADAGVADMVDDNCNEAEELDARVMPGSGLKFVSLVFDTFLWPILDPNSELFAPRIDAALLSLVDEGADDEADADLNDDEYPGFFSKRGVDSQSEGIFSRCSSKSSMM